jgi:release factor glutamine methyltransferase
MTIQEATYFLLNKLRTIYPAGEAGQVTDRIMESVTGSNKTERMFYKTSAITEHEELRLQQYAERLMKHEPMQYVLNESWFCGLKFYVDNNVLIPRPETEELVEWVVSDVRRTMYDVRSGESAIRVFDIGAGSGCIPVVLKKKIKEAEVWSCDVSESALEVAKRNATMIGVDLNFLLLNFLDKERWDQLPRFDIIISNPPYVPEQDKSSMAPNVLNYEPHTALFVPDNDLLVFYRAIAEFGKKHLNTHGAIYTEIHESQGESAAQLFESFGYKTETRKDMQGKERIIKTFD